jgi:hypothetical protein
LANEARDTALAQQADAVAARLTAENTMAAQAVVDSATAQAATAAGNAAAAAAAAGGPAGPIIFVLSPALANSNVLRNYNTLEGIQINNKTMAVMEALYNGGSGNLTLPKQNTAEG